MANPIPTFTPLVSRQLLSFYDPSNPGTIVTPKFNAKTLVRTVSNVRKYTKTVNGTSVIMGDREYPPSEILFDYPMADISDYEAIRRMTQYNPLVMIDNNDDGFYGTLILDTPQQLAGYSGNVWSFKGAFLVQKPYNGRFSTVNTLSAPTAGAPSTGSNGIIPASTTFYVWLSSCSIWGESTVGAPITLTSGGGSTNSFSISWTPPTSNYYRKTRVYWSSANDSTTSTLLTEVRAGQTNSFSITTTPQVYSYEKPKTINTAFTGLWLGGRWANGT